MSNGGPTRELGPILGEIDTQTRAIADDVTDIYNHVRDLFGIATDKVTGLPPGTAPTPTQPRLREHFGQLARIHSELSDIRKTLTLHMDGEGMKR